MRFARAAREQLTGRNVDALNLTEVRVQDCVAWIVHFLGFTERTELIRRYDAAPAAREGTIVDGQLQFRIAANLSTEESLL